MGRRRGERYKLSLPVQLNDGTGMTRDISTSGIFFETDSAHSIGDTIRLFLNFKHETLQCEAQVVWVERKPSLKLEDADAWLRLPGGNQKRMPKIYVACERDERRATTTGGHQL